MNKREFIIEAALRMVSQGMPVAYITHVATRLADELFPGAPTHNGKPETDPIVVLLGEVGRLEKESVNEQGRRSQISGLQSRLRLVLVAENILTVADLLKRGRIEFMKMRKVGKLCVETVDTALYNLYGIKSW